jgi:hypothetical protein
VKGENFLRKGSGLRPYELARDPISIPHNTHTHNKYEGGAVVVGEGNQKTGRVSGMRWKVMARSRISDEVRRDQKRYGDGG